MQVPTTTYPIIVDSAGRPVGAVPQRREQRGGFTALSPTTTLTDTSRNGGETYSALSPNDTQQDDPEYDIHHPINSRVSEESISSSIVIPEYKDMSNSKLTNITAIVIFSIVSCLNLFMIASMAMGADVHF